MVLGLAFGIDDDLIGYATLLAVMLVLTLGWAVVRGAYRESSCDR